MICCHCNQNLDSSMFYRNKNTKTGFTCRCKECSKLYIKDKEKRREYEKKYWSDPDRKERKKQMVRSSMDKNKAAYAEKRREYLKTDAGIAMYRRQTQKRYAMAKAAFVEDVNPMELFAEQGGVCYLCKSSFSFNKMELDHVYPIAKGGKHEKSNCKMACARCNRSKGAKTAEEYMNALV